MNRELEALILAYEALSSARDTKAEQALQVFESLLDGVLNQHPNIERDKLRKSIIKAHLKWARKQVNKPTAIPPKA